ncbi:MAG: archaellin/type IV pilin N-terminal domain-containing protein [Candidatus Bathyarchaeia archaeon]
MRRFVRCRRGLSPVVTTVLMILVAIIGMSLLFAFFVNYARDFQLGSGSAVLESLVIEDVWFRNATYAEIWVYNVGKVPCKVTSVYVNDLFAALVEDSAFDVAVGAHGLLRLNGEFAVGGDYTIKVVTSRGSAFEGRYAWEP